jgi:hypothetical protein
MLAEATGWLASHREQLNKRECDFIEASRDNAKAEADNELRRTQERERFATNLANSQC